MRNANVQWQRRSKDTIESYLRTGYVKEIVEPERKVALSATDCEFGKRVEPPDGVECP